MRTEADNTKPKLCFIVPSYSRTDATHFYHVYDLISELAKRFDIFLIVEKGELPDDDLGCARAVCIHSRRFIFRWCELHWWLLTARFLGYKDAYVHYSFLGAIATSIVMRPTGGMVAYWNCGEPWKYKRSMVRDWFEHLAYDAVSFLVTGTEGLGKKYSEVYGIPAKRIKIMPNWISLKRFTPLEKNHPSATGAVPSAGRSLAGFIAPPADSLRETLHLGNDKVVLFVHRLSKRKGALHLPAIAKGIYPHRLLIIGEGPELPSLTNVFREESIGNMRILGVVPNSELPRYYSIASALIIPSEEEGFPRVMLEAAALGVPFTAFDVGGIREVIPERLRAYLAPGGDIKTLIAHAKTLIELMPDKRASLSGELHEWVKQFDLPIVADRFTDIILHQ